ncbi:hypothetical protein V6N11_033780 [Hibiscus sabdariffa]|uniref:Uncharacterized protein n=1 Tax=Hibiscus sabdariffa TaxID=183260 RepID=A0ABR2S0I3_9ROSI
MRIERYLDHFTKREPIGEETCLEIPSSMMEPLLEGKLDASIAQRNHFRGANDLVALDHHMKTNQCGTHHCGLNIKGHRKGQLIGAETKEKRKRKVSTPNLRAAKSVPTTLVLTDSVAMLTKVIQNQEAILPNLARLERKNIALLHYLNSWDVAIRETFMSLSPGIMPTFPIFHVDLFSRDFSQPTSPKAHSSTPNRC